MFDFGYGELLIIGIAALIFIGPKELPGVLRTAGQWMARIRRMAGEFQNQFQEAMREAELADLKKEVDDMAAHAANYANFDPLSEVRQEMASAQHDIEKSLADKPAADAATHAPAAPAASEAAAPSPGPAPAEPANAVTGPPQDISLSAPAAPASLADAPAQVQPQAEPSHAPVKQDAGGSAPP